MDGTAQLPDGREDEGCYRVDGRPLGERNPKWLTDDYVKFLRLAQWQVDWSGEGVVGFVLNHNLFDAPTFRGLRRSLLRTFQEVYALDLHGNARKRERGPRGERDENVFPEVAQGAAVLLLVKKSGLRPRVLRADLYGSRQDKLRFLDRSDVQSTPWQEVAPGPPGYLFLAGDRAVEREYQRGLALPEIFPVHGVGIITGRDAVVTAVDRRTLERRVADLRERSPEGAPPGLSAHHALLGYVYAVLYSATYRRRYRELLDRGFPRIAFPEDPRLFVTVAGLGRELMGVHLLEDPRLRDTRVLLVNDGDRRVALGRDYQYGESDRRLFLNERGLALVGLEPEAWSYRIGGYCVLSQLAEGPCGEAARRRGKKAPADDR